MACTLGSVAMEWKQTLQSSYTFKVEYFLMTDLYDTDISLITKNSKSVTLTSRSVRRCGVGMEQRKILDQYRTSDKVSTSSIQRFKRYSVLKTFNQKL